MLPTKRFMIEPTLECNIKCKFCYHLHKYDIWKDTRKSFDQMTKEIDAGKARGNEWMDITGGEPTIHQEICDIVKYAKDQGLKVCIITNGIVSQTKSDELIKFGIDEFLVSRHGLENTHNTITNTKNGYNQQIEFLRNIEDKVQIRFNCVINKLNQSDIAEIARKLIVWKPKIINFINFNPHHEWKNVDFKKEDIIADLRIVEPHLNQAINYLEKNNINVNVRYYPMCRISEKYRHCICNDLQVMFDPYEWDYNTMPKTIDRYYEWGRVTSNNNEEKCYPCNKCDLQKVCGGGNKYFHKAANELYGEQFDKQIVPEIKKLSDIDKMWYYRQYAKTI